MNKFQNLQKFLKIAGVSYAASIYLSGVDDHCLVRIMLHHIKAPNNFLAGKPCQGLPAGVPVAIATEVAAIVAVSLQG